MNGLPTARPGSYALRSVATRGTRALVNPWLTRLTADPEYDVRHTIFIAGWARSGTTWLAEVLSSIPQSAIMFEPLHQERVPEAAAAGFPVKGILAPGAGTQAQKDFMSRALRGRVLNWWTCSANPVARSVSPRVWIVKEIHANYLIAWILGTFPVTRAVMIIRHPCATIASRMAQGWTAKDIQDVQYKVKNRAARERYPHLDAICRHLKDPVEALAARWCLMNYVPLSLNPRPFHVIAYESLAVHGLRDLLPMLSAWNLSTPSAMQHSLGRASATTKANAMSEGTHQQAIDRWKRVLTPEQIDRILAVVRDFGMDFYTDAAEPDYSRLREPLAS
jgi:hypothetical protein